MAAVVVVAAGAWATLHSPVLAARHVTVIGAVHTGVGPVVAAVGLNGQPLVDVNPGRVAARVEALPWVAHATVTRHWPDDVTVTVVERVAGGRGAGPRVTDRFWWTPRGTCCSSAQEAPPGTPVVLAPVVSGPPGSVLGTGRRPRSDGAGRRPAPAATAPRAGGRWAPTATSPWPSPDTSA